MVGTSWNSLSLRPNIKDIWGWILLHNAINLQAAKLVTLLIENGSDVNEGYTTLHMLADGKYDDNYVCEINIIVLKRGRPYTSR